MTQKQVKEMTDEQLRIKMAELCGWKYAGKWSPAGKPYPEDHHGTKFDIGKNHVGCSCHRLPDYPRDLNAMHEAEKTFSTYGKEQEYYKNLIGVVYVWDYSCGINGAKVAHATARQRAEAFVLTMEESK